MVNNTCLIEFDSVVVVGRTEGVNSKKTEKTCFRRTGKAFREFEDAAGNRENGLIYRKSKKDLETVQTRLTDIKNNFVLRRLSAPVLKIHDHVKQYKL